MGLGTLGLAGTMAALGASWAMAALPLTHRGPSTMPVGFPVAVEELSAHHKEVRQVLQNPTLAAQGPSDTFACQPEHYYYFLDHPDQAVQAWRKLGAKCVGINDLGNGQFGWGDDLGSEVTWETVFRSPSMRIWYAHGKVRPAPVLPMVPVQLVVVLHHVEKKSADDASTIEHISEAYVHTDSRAASLLARMMGTSTTRVAEQGLHQMQLFFSTLCWYIDQNPRRAAMLVDSQR